MMAATKKDVGSISLKKIILSKFRNKWFLIVIVGVVLVSFLFSIRWMIVGRSDKRERTEASQYLEKKYGKHFVVKDDQNPIVKRALGDPPKFDGRAYAIDDPDLTFWVGRQTDPTGVFDDTYLKALWTRQAREGEVRDLLQGMFGKLPEYEVTVNPLSSALTNKYYGATPSFSEVRGHANEGLFYMIDVRLHGELAAVGRSSHADNIYTLVKFMQNSKASEPSVIYRVFANEKDKPVTCYIGQGKLKDVQSASDLSGCLK